MKLTKDQIAQFSAGTLKQRAVVVYDNNGSTPFSVWTLEQFRAKYQGKKQPKHLIVRFDYDSALPDQAP